MRGEGQVQITGINPLTGGWGAGGGGPVQRRGINPVTGCGG